MDDPDIGRDTERQARKRPQLLALAVTAAGLVGLIVYQNGLPEDTTVRDDNGEPPSITHAATALRGTINLQQPFVGTPAAGWRDDIAGLRAPNPRAVGEFTQEQVTQAVRAARRFLSTVLLDRRVIELHDFTPALRLVAPAARAERPPDASAPMSGEHPSVHAVQIDRKYPLLPAAPKLKGQMTAESGGTGIFDHQSEHVGRIRV